MFPRYAIISFILIYLLLQFGIAFIARRPSLKKWLDHPLTYALSIGLFCSAWTFYGSIGAASRGGVEFLAVYAGPIIAVPLWIIFLKKTIKIAQLNNVTSLADFISIRYGNSRFIGALVTIICLFSILPYIGLQIKAITDSTEFMTSGDAGVSNFSLLIVLILALFASFFGVRYTDDNDRHDSIVFTVAVESVIKLICFIIVGVTIFVLYINEGVTQLNTSELPQLGGLEGGLNWMMFLLASMFAIVLLPRQFQMAVVDNRSQDHLKTAMWFVPVYLLLFILFVWPVATMGGLLDAGGNPDLYLLSVPLALDKPALSMLAYIGGFSAAISMIVVSSIALSTMITNNIIIPYGLVQRLNSRDMESNQATIKLLRRVGIFVSIILAYVLYRFFFAEASLISIGWIAFVLVAQFVPTYFGAIYWRRATRSGATAGLIIGFLICAYTLLFPYTVSGQWLDEKFVGVWSFLHPLSLFGIDIFEPIPHAMFWSLVGNGFAFVYFSVRQQGDYRERNMAELFVDIEKYGEDVEKAFVWKGTAFVSDIVNLLNRFLGVELTQKVQKKYQIVEGEFVNDQAEPGFIRLAERLLTSRVGPSSAKILISNVVKEEEISLQEVLQILDESHEKAIQNQQLISQSNQLEQLSQQLKSINNELQERDKEKDEFLDIVSHELKTPITSIRASVELIMEDHEEMPKELFDQFTQNIMVEIDRVTRLVNNLLDLEKVATEKYRLRLRKHDLNETIENVKESLEPVLSQKEINLEIKGTAEDVKAVFDKDKVKQVLNNLITNAFKFSETNSEIWIAIDSDENEFLITVEDFGQGISKEESELIFNKFYQAKQLKFTEGVGLGLAISQRIIQLHQGRIWAESKSDGARFIFTLPKYITNVNAYEKGIDS